VIIFLRHGQTAPNRAGLLLGRSDPPLTEHGCAQARRLSETIQQLAPKAVFASPLLRARQTAELIAESVGRFRAARGREPA
jgi:broad specificity phosphatase PhoE